MLPLNGIRPFGVNPILEKIVRTWLKTDNIVPLGEGCYTLPNSPFIFVPKRI